MLTIVHILVTLCVLKYVIGNPCPPCTCYNHTVTCVNTGMSYIPTVPNDTTTFHFVGNHIVELTRESLSNLTECNLKTLQLSNDEIQRISHDAFADMRNLGSLDISRNMIPIQQLRDALCVFNVSQLTNLNLGNMGITSSLPVDFFECLRGSYIYSLNLDYNNITSFSSQTVSALTALKILNLTNNKIITFTLDEPLLSLTFLELRHNFLSNVPKFSLNTRALAPKLQSLRMSNNHIFSIDKSSFLGLPNLEYLDLKVNYIKSLKNNAFSMLPKLFHLSVASNALRTIESYAFNSSSLSYLDISRNVFHFETCDTRNLFRLTRNLDTLYITDNYLRDVGNIKLGDMFSPLTKLTRLLMANNRLNRLPPTILPHLSELQELELSENNIASWDPQAFKNLRKLKKLLLDDNIIKLITETSIPPSILNNHEYLNIAQNPFSCTCDLMWFRNWLRTTKVRVVSLGKKGMFLCSFPKDMQNKPLLSYNPTLESCRKTKEDLLLILGSTAGCFILLATVISAFVYKYRWNIRYWFYVVRAKRKQYEEIVDGNVYEYDAFVTYNKHDRDWVLEYLLPNVEYSGNFKLCIHERNFELGRDIMDNIVESIEGSRKVILILSDHFAASQWCQWETAMAQTQVIDKQKNILILVLLGDISEKNMTNRLSLLLREKTYIEWSAKSEGHALFWTRLKSALKRPSQSINS